MDKVAFTSDSHYAHDNIIKYSNRPFANIEEMNTALVNGINEVLPEGGTLYHLGDWSMSKIDYAFEFKNRINKNIEIILIEGNHDDNKLRDPNFRKLFKGIYPLLEVHVNKKRITLCHYAMKTFNKMNHGAWHLYGHSHAGLPDDPNQLSLDVGVDSAYKILGEYRPFTFTEIADWMSRKTFKALDHHI